MIKEYNFRKGKKGGVFSSTTSDELDIDIWDDKDNHGQAIIKWTHIFGLGTCPELCLFNDSWFLIPHLKDFFDYLESNNNKNLTPKDIMTELERLGIRKASYCKV